MRGFFGVGANRLRQVGATVLRWSVQTGFAVGARWLLIGASRDRGIRSFGDGWEGGSLRLAVIEYTLNEAIHARGCSYGALLLFNG